MDPIAQQPAIAHSPVTIMQLHYRKGAFHLKADPGQRPIARGQLRIRIARSAPPGPAHDAIGDRQPPQQFTPPAAVVSLVGKHCTLVPADQLIGRLTVVGFGPGQQHLADEAAAEVHRHVCLVTKVRGLALAPGPLRVRIQPRALAQILSALAGARFLDCRAHQRSIDQGAALDHQLLTLELGADFAEQRLIQTSRGQLRAKTADRGMVGYLLIERQPRELAKTNSILQRRFQLRVRQPMPLLQQQRAQHHDRWIRRSSFARCVQLRHALRQPLPIHQFIHRLQPMLGLAPRDYALRQTQLPHHPMTHRPLLLRIPCINLIKDTRVMQRFPEKGEDRR